MENEFEARFSRRAHNVSLMQLIWPLLLGWGINFALSKFIESNAVAFSQNGILALIMLFIVIALDVVFVLGYNAYIFNIARVGDATLSDILECVRNKFWRLIGYTTLLMFIIFLIIFLVISLTISGFARLILITAAIMYLFLNFGMAALLLVDTDLGVIDSLTTSKKMLSGHRMEFLKLSLTLAKSIIITSVILYGVSLLMVNGLTDKAADSLMQGDFEGYVDILVGVQKWVRFRSLIITIVTFLTLPRMKLGIAEYYDHLTAKNNRPKIKFVIANQKNVEEEIEQLEETGDVEEFFGGNLKPLGSSQNKDSAEDASGFSR